MESEGNRVRIVEIPVRIRTLPTRIIYWLVFFAVVTGVIGAARRMFSIPQSPLLVLTLMIVIGMVAAAVLGIIPTIQQYRGVRRDFRGHSTFSRPLNPFILTSL